MLNFTGKTANFEEWYEEIKEFTPVSTYFQVDEDAKKVIMARTFDVLEQKIPYFSEMNDRMSTTGIDEVAKLTALVDLMDMHIEGKEVFFRSNLYSPKDVKDSCIVSSGNEALSLLLASTRMYNGYYKLLKDLPLYLVFREKVDFQNEFRCFIADGHVKGISQAEDSDSIRLGIGASKIQGYSLNDYLRVLDYVESVVQETEMENVVLDVGISTTGIHVIELNPYGNLTDKSLFAKEDVYSSGTSTTFIRFWKDQKTISVLEIEEGAVIQRYEETIELTSNLPTDDYHDLLNSLQFLTQK